MKKMTRTKIIKCYKFCVCQPEKVSMAVIRAQGNKEEVLVEERDYRGGNKELGRELIMKIWPTQNRDRGELSFQRRVHSEPNGVQWSVET